MDWGNEICTGLHELQIQSQSCGFTFNCALKMFNCNGPIQTWQIYWYTTQISFRPAQICFTGDRLSSQRQPCVSLNLLTHCWIRAWTSLSGFSNFRIMCWPIGFWNQYMNTHPHSRSTLPKGSPDTACILYSRNSSHQSDGTGTAPAETRTLTCMSTGALVSTLIISKWGSTWTKQQQ